jgi:hypothetical protein
VQPIKRYATFPTACLPWIAFNLNPIKRDTLQAALRPMVT